MPETPKSFRFIDRPRLKVQFQWEPRDLWIGLFWRVSPTAPPLVTLHLYICLVPMLPLHVSWLRRRPLLGQAWVNRATSSDGPEL